MMSKRSCSASAWTNLADDKGDDDIGDGDPTICVDKPWGSW